MILYLIYLSISLSFQLITDVPVVKSDSLLHPPTFTTDRIRDMNIANDVSRKIPYARLIGFKHWNLLLLTITCSYFSLFTVVLGKHDKRVDPQFRNLPNWLIPQLTHRCTVVQREGSRKIPFNSSFSTKSSVLTTKSFSWSLFKIHIRLGIVFPRKI